MPTQEDQTAEENAPESKTMPEPETSSQMKPTSENDEDFAPDNAESPVASESSEGDQDRQTIAQMFGDLPTGLKIGIFVVLAIMLAVGLLSIFLPGANEQVEEGATETAVAIAALTLTAQPTSTPIGTETPRIYIVVESPTPTLTPIVTSTPVVYVVQAGDTLNSIARRYGATVQDISLANNLYNPNSITVGQELIIPTPGPGTSVPIATSGPGTPTVVPMVENPTSAPLMELVIKNVDTVDLRIAAGEEYQSITTLNKGTLAALVAKTPDGKWFLIQLEDGFTRGWVPADSTGLIYPADPDNIPTTPAP